MKVLAICIVYLLKACDRVLIYLFKSMFCKCGKNVILHPLKSDFTYKNIIVRDNVYIEASASFIVSVSQIVIDDKVLFDPHVTIRGGNHSSHIVGKLL